MNDKPLVTISMLTYNQEKYVRESVRGLLSQTYEPLEIVISDDHSTDRTWDIINEEIDAYKASGGIHKNIVLNRNEKNLGIARHCNVTSKMKHGALIVSNAGDDISFPNRVERIVEEWIKDGSRAVVIFHGAIQLDTCGRKLAEIGRRDVDSPLGAVTAYCPANCRYHFPPISVPYAYEDRIYAKRSKMQGPQLVIRESLMYYRVGAGVSSSLGNRRQMTTRLLLSDIYCYRQLLMDLESVRQLMPKNIFESFRREFIAERKYARLNLILLSNKHIKIRFRACREMMRLREGGNVIAFSVFMMPRPVCDIIWDSVVRLRHLKTSIISKMRDARAA